MYHSYLLFQLDNLSSQATEVSKALDMNRYIQEVGLIACMCVWRGDGVCTCMHASSGLVHMNFL